MLRHTYIVCLVFSVGKFVLMLFETSNTSGCLVALILQDGVLHYSTEIVFKKKSKSVPLQARSGPEGFRKLRFPDFVTTAQDGGKVASLTHRPPLPPGNTPGTHFC